MRQCLNELIRLLADEQKYISELKGELKVDMMVCYLMNPFKHCRAFEMILQISPPENF
jgi:hypothetical protein